MARLDSLLFWKSYSKEVKAVLVAAVLAAAGWGALELQKWWVSKHALDGQIIFSSFGFDPFDRGHRLKVLVYTLLENKREAPISPFKYVLKVDHGSGLRPLQMVVDNSPGEFVVRIPREAATSFDFDSAFAMIFPPELFLSRSLTSPIARGVAAKGFLWFGGSDKIEYKAVRAMVLEVTDSAGDTYTITPKNDLWGNPKEMLGMERTIQLQPPPSGWTNPEVSTPKADAASIPSQP